MAMERANLLNMAKLSIKGLIESALSFGRTLDSDYPPLQQFFVVMEHCLKHGLKGTVCSAITKQLATENHLLPHLLYTTSESFEVFTCLLFGRISDLVLNILCYKISFILPMLLFFLGTRQIAPTFMSCLSIIGKEN